MKFVVEINDAIYPIRQLDEHDFREAAKIDIVGVPAYFVDVSSVYYFYPRPMKEFKVYRLEEWSYADGRLV